MKKWGQKTRLAAELGISQAAVTKLSKRGMPIDDADAARRWRLDHLDRGRMRPDPGPSPATLLQRAQRLVDVASVALDHHTLEAVADGLRAALRDVPESHRSQVQMSHALWRALMGAHALAVLDEGPKHEAGTMSDEAGTMSDEDADYVGSICYMLACGEAHIT